MKLPDYGSLFPDQVDRINGEGKGDLVVYEEDGQDGALVVPIDPTDTKKLEEFGEISRRRDQRISKTGCLFSVRAQRMTSECRIEFFVGARQAENQESSVLDRQRLLWREALIGTKCRRWIRRRRRHRSHRPSRRSKRREKIKKNRREKIHDMKRKFNIGKEHSADRGEADDDSGRFNRGEGGNHAGTV